MQKLAQTLDLDALRSFVTGMECGSFAQAAVRLCRSTSAVSAQLKKLEQQCGSKLVVKSGRHLALTREGEVMMGYARRLLALNDEALCTFSGVGLQGEVRLGMQEDFGDTLMPGILGEFTRHHPGLRIIARVARNQELLAALDSDALDMALLWQAQPLQRKGVLIGQFPLEWIAHPDCDVSAMISQGEPLPLVMFDNPCLMRSRAIDSLDRAGIAWRIVFVSHSLSGIWAAVRAGLGITVRTRVGMPANLVSAGNVLPPLGALGVTLEQKSGSQTEPNAQNLLARLMENALRSLEPLPGLRPA